uniref:Uncharacterized protein n=1 Tax=Vitis vinifera TaxID=29760 RepID=F6HAN2_VITVI
MFKCHGYGHITSEYPNHRIVTLVEEDSDEEVIQTLKMTMPFRTSVIERFVNRAC